jgi:hypothetical protein
VEILFILVPVFIGVVFVIILVQLGKQVAEWADNNGKPILSATSGSASHDSGGTVSTSYYATSEYDSGQRKEFRLDGGAYGLLVEGDEGTLTYQGTRYHRFERNLRPA